MSDAKLETHIAGMKECIERLEATLAHRNEQVSALTLELCDIKAELEEKLESEALHRTLERTFPDISGKYRQSAQKQYHREGELEINERTEITLTRSGAWVGARVFIPCEVAGVDPIDDAVALEKLEQ